MWSVCTQRPKVRVRVKGPTHLTAVENRLHVVETALGKLFPDGDMHALALDILLDEGINSQQRPINLGGSPATSIAISEDPISSDYGLVGDQQLSPDEPPGHFGMEIDPPLRSPPLVTGREHTQFIDNYFAQYHVLYPILHEKSFRRDLQAQSPSPLFRLLVQIILAIGAWLRPQAHEGLDEKFFVEAQRQFQRIPITDQTDISIVQALILMGDVAQKQGSAEESGHYIGTALRIAVTLNLHAEPPVSLSELDKEIRRRVWWSVYCAESCSAKIYGRPLLLPDDNLITALTRSSRQLPAPTDDTTIYTGLIQQSNYHRMANKIYRQLLSKPLVTPKDVDEAEQTIDAWHRSTLFCVQVRDRDARPEWQFIARHRQILCDTSLRLLIHRPMLLRWFKISKSSSHTVETAYPDNGSEARCRAHGLKIARNTISVIVDTLSRGRYSRLTLAFTLYAFFHALIVPLIHLKTDPWAPTSISCMQDLEKAKSVLDNLPIERDALSRYFAVVLRRLFTVASQVNEGSIGDKVVASERGIGSNVLQRRSHDIFGREELSLLEAGSFSPSCGLDFSEWVHL
ncbi:fungal-specific transcription factor domain-containing protein [Aspergillus floccosus]